jgi:N utilization substance protein B
MTEPLQTPKSAPRPKKAADKSGRTRAREFALQALYQHLVGRNEPADIDLFTRDLSGFHKCDSAHYDALLHGCIAQGAELDKAIAAHARPPDGGGVPHRARRVVDRRL